MTDEQQVSGDQLEAAAPVSDVQSEPQPEQVSEEGQQVPLSALQSERAQRQQVQDELKMMKDHLALIQAQQQSQPQAQQPKEEIDNLADDDVLTVGEAKKILTRMNQQYQGSIEELRMAQKYPNYREVVTNYLPEVIKQNPSIAQTLQGSQDYELAYYLATHTEKYKADHKRAKKHADAERIVQNSSQPGSLSSVGQISPVNQAKKYKDMSDKDFRKEVHRNLGYA